MIPLDVEGYQSGGTAAPDVARYSKKPAAKQEEDAERLAKWGQEIDQKAKDIEAFRALA